MKQKVLWALFAVIISSAFVFGQGSEPIKASILAPDKLSYGMKFYGFSTLGPKEQTKFTGKILGVLKNYLGPGHDWIVASIDGSNFRETGVIAGQSGSPVYVTVNGKKYFVGTVSYAEAYSKNAIAYLTPANELLAAGSYSNEKSEETLSPSAMKKDVGEFLSLHNCAQMREMLERGAMDASSFVATSEGKAQKEVKPGDVLSVQLAYGDFNFGGFGTVSYVDKKTNRIFMFGHPMFQLGPVEYRLAPAKVLGVQAGYKDSHIIAAPIEGAKTVGIITQDRETAIMGILGQEPKNFIPFKVKLVNSAGIARNYTFYSTSDRTVGPVVGAIGILEMVSSWSRSSGPKTIFLKGQIVTDMATVSVNDEFHGDSKLDMQAAKSIWERLQAVLDNGYKKIGIKEVDLEVDMFDEIRMLKVERIIADTSVVSPGGRVDIKIILSQPGKEMKTLDLSIEIPKDSNFGTAKIIVGSADAVTSLENTDSKIVNLNTLIELMDQKRSPNKLYVYMVYPPSKTNASSYENSKLGIRMISKRLSSVAEEYEISPELAGLFTGIKGDFIIEGKDTLELKISDKSFTTFTLFNH